MYKTDRLGPWPIIDLGHNVSSDASAASYGSATELNVFLESTALGGDSIAYMNLEMDSSISISNDANHSIGVLLQPLSSVSSTISQIMIELSGICIAYNAAYLPYMPFIGTIDKSLTPAAGYDATNNVCSNYALLPFRGVSHSTCVNTNIVLADIITGIDNDDYIVAGWTFFNTNTGSIAISNIRSTLSCRYNRGGININERG
jgi:hypothetical protein